MARRRKVPFLTPPLPQEAARLRLKRRSTLFLFPPPFLSLTLKSTMAQVFLLFSPESDDAPACGRGPSVFIPFSVTLMSGDLSSPYFFLLFSQLDTASSARLFLVGDDGGHDKCAGTLVSPPTSSLSFFSFFKQRNSCSPFCGCPGRPRSPLPFFSLSFSFSVPQLGDELLKPHLNSSQPVLRQDEGAVIAFRCLSL